MGGLHARGVSRIRKPAAHKDSRHLSRQSLLVKLLLTWLCPEEKEFLHLGRMPPVARAEAVAMANMARDERGQVNHSATRGSCRGVSGASFRRFGLELCRLARGSFRAVIQALSHRGPDSALAWKGDAAEEQALLSAECHPMIQCPGGNHCLPWYAGLRSTNASSCGSSCTTGPRLARLISKMEAPSPLGWPTLVGTCNMKVRRIQEELLRGIAESWQRRVTRLS